MICCQLVNADSFDVVPPGDFISGGFEYDDAKPMPFRSIVLI